MTYVYMYHEPATYPHCVAVSLSVYVLGLCVYVPVTATVTEPAAALTISDLGGRMNLMDESYESIPCGIGPSVAHSQD